MGDLIVHTIVVYLTICLMANYKRVKRNHRLTVEKNLDILDPQYADGDSLVITGVLSGLALLFLGAVEYAVLEALI
jgi:hypothetical protein